MNGLGGAFQADDNDNDNNTNNKLEYLIGSPDCDVREVFCS